MINSFKLCTCLFVSLFFLACNEADIHMEEAQSDWMFQQRAFPYGDIKVESFLKALKQKESGLQKSKSAAYDEKWTLIGPSNVGGRVIDIEMFEDDLQTIFVGSASGGIFKSTDQGVSWEPIFDEAASLSIGDIAISKSNSEIIYVGTGEANSGGGSIAYDGLGMYKSDDAGENWEYIGLQNVGSIGKVAIDPEDPEKVFVAAMGRLFGRNEERGIFRTKDGGDTWDQVLSLSDSTGGIDLAIHPLNPDTIFAAMWERTRRPNDIIYGGITSGLYRSYDGGDSWTLLENGLPNDPNDGKGRMAVTIAPSNPSVMYVYVTTKEGYTEGIYKSTDLGDSWQAISIEGLPFIPSQYWFCRLVVNPNNEDDLFFASLNMHRKISAGSVWREIFDNAHVDHHALYIHPMDEDLILNGNDGGVYVSTLNIENYFNADDMPNIQFYTCEIDPNNTDIVFGGTQDNGTWKNVGDDENSWDKIFGGDGFRVVVEPGNSDIVYLEYQNGNIFRSDEGGFSAQYIVNDIPNSDRKNWNSPIAIDYNEPNIIFIGTQRIWKSTNRGDNWEAMSSDLSNGPYPGNRTFGTVVTIEVSRANSNKVYAGTDDGNVWISLDGGDNWGQTFPPMSVPRWTTAVLPDPIDENTAYLTFSGFRYDTNDGQIYKTTDNGLTWDDITGDLPDIPVNDIQVDLNDNSRLFIATDIGVFYSLNNGENWIVLGTKLPNVPVVDIDLEHDGKLAAATYGRSMYYYRIPDTMTDLDLVQNENIEIYPNPATDIINIRLKNMNVSDKTFSIINLKGQNLIQSKEPNIEVHSLPKGYYILNVESDSGEILATQKFSKL